MKLYSQSNGEKNHITQTSTQIVTKKWEGLLLEDIALTIVSCSIIWYSQLRKVEQINVL